MFAAGPAKFSFCSATTACVTGLRGGQKP